MTTRLAPPLEVAGRLLAGGEEAGGLDHDVDAVVAPRDLGRDPCTSSFLISRPSIEKPLSVALTSFGERAADRVVLEQERHGVRVAERVVHRHQLDPGVARPGRAAPG